MDRGRVSLALFMVLSGRMASGEMRRALATWAVVAGIFGGTASVAAENPVYRRLADDGWESELVRGALRGAQRRLARSTCQQVFSDFSDAWGRTLRENLDALGQTPERYLDMLIFYDAAGSGRCGNPNILAMTSPGNRAIFVCAAQFARKGLTDRRQTEMILIHETLHTLGLGENPPTSREITARVMERCR